MKISCQLDDIVSGQVAFVVWACQLGSTAPLGVGEANVILSAAAASGSGSGSGPSLASASFAADVVLFQLCMKASVAQDEISARSSPSYRLSHIIMTVPDLWQE